MLWTTPSLDDAKQRPTLECQTKRIQDPTIRVPLSEFIHRRYSSLCPRGRLGAAPGVEGARSGVAGKEDFRSFHSEGTFRNSHRSPRAIGHCIIASVCSIGSFVLVTWASIYGSYSVACPLFLPNVHSLPCFVGQRHLTSPAAAASTKSVYLPVGAALTAGAVTSFVTSIPDAAVAARSTPFGSLPTLRAAAAWHEYAAAVATTGSSTVVWPQAMTANHPGNAAMVNNALPFRDQVLQRLTALGKCTSNTASSERAGRHHCHSPGPPTRPLSFSDQRSVKHPSTRYGPAKCSNGMDEGFVRVNDGSKAQRYYETLIIGGDMRSTPFVHRLHGINPLGAIRRLNADDQLPSLSLPELTGIPAGSSRGQNVRTAVPLAASRSAVELPAENDWGLNGAILTKPAAGRLRRPLESKVDTAADVSASTALPLKAETPRKSPMASRRGAAMLLNHILLHDHSESSSDCTQTDAEMVTSIRNAFRQVIEK